MNIVKVKDIVGLGDFKNQYCYCVNWKWIIRFEDYTQAEYIYCEQNSWVDAQRPYMVYADAVTAGYVDADATEKASSIVKFIEYNKFSPDEDITIEELKLFRTWLATTLYNILVVDTDTAYETIEMLKYYKGEMSDDTVKHLEKFVTDFVTYDTNSTSGCGCSTTATVLASNTLVSTCEPLKIYRKGIYNYMVTLFSDIDFWSQFETEVLTEFKKYIDNIIKLDFPLYTAEYVSDLYECNCLSNDKTVQQTLMLILSNLSISLGYMIAGETTGHKNFIADTLNQWSAKLYEKMRWS